MGITYRRVLRLAVVLSLAACAIALTTNADTLPAQASPTPKQPSHQPAPDKVSFDLPKLTPANPSASLTLETPQGPVTLTASLSDAAPITSPGAVGGAPDGFAPQTVYQRQCSAWMTIPATAAFGITNSFQYDYNSVVWIGGLYYNEWYVPP